jgi:hypothetical protein
VIRRLPTIAIVLALLAAACRGDDEPPPAPTGPATPTGDATTFSAQVASSDLAADDEERVQIGVFSSTEDAGVQLLSFGEIGVEFSYLGADGSSPPATGPAATASFVPAAGDEDADGIGPTLTNPSDVAGVYITPAIAFPEPGVWSAAVTVSVDSGDPITLESVFPVYPEHRIPAPGDRAEATENLTMRSKGVPASAIDSRAQDGEPVPDPELHDSTIADALRQGRPALVQFATPLFCTSHFCGPTVEAQEELAREYGDVAEFIHVEIYRTYTADERVVNDAVTEWLLPDDGGDITEPWLYLIDADGRITDRWGPLFDLDEVRAALDELRG